MSTSKAGKAGKVADNMAPHSPDTRLIGYNGIDSRGWLILSPTCPPTSTDADALYQDEGAIEECWYILKALLASSLYTHDTLSTDAKRALHTLLEQKCPSWRGLAKVWVAQKSLHVDYVEAVKQELLVPHAFYTCFPTK